MELDEHQLDTLKEIGNIGAGNASNALSQMTGERIDIDFPSIEVKDIKKIPEVIGDRSNMHTVIRIDVGVDNENDEEISLGTLVLVFDLNSAKELAAHLTGNSDEGHELTMQEESALKETGNILTGSTLTAMTEMVNLRLDEGVPHIKTDMLGAVMDEILLKMAKTEDQALVFRTNFNFKENVNAYFMFLFSKRGQELILEELVV